MEQRDREARIEVTMSPKEKIEIRTAAAAEDRSMASFLRRAGLELARTGNPPDQVCDMDPKGHFAAAVVDVMREDFDPTESFETFHDRARTKIVPFHARPPMGEIRFAFDQLHEEHAEAANA